MRLLIIVGSFLLIIVACRRDSGDIIDKTLRHTLKSAKVEVLKPAKPHDSKVVELGQKLMFDKILSGKRIFPVRLAITQSYMPVMQFLYPLELEERVWVPLECSVRDASLIHEILQRFSAEDFLAL